VWGTVDDISVVWGTVDDISVMWVTVDDISVMWGTVDDISVVWAVLYPSRKFVFSLKSFSPISNQLQGDTYMHLA